MGHQEIERKFLVKDDSYKQKATACIPISQGYLSLNERCSVRVRRWGDKGFITVKSHIVQNHFGHWVLHLSQTDGHHFALLVLSALFFNPQKSGNIYGKQADEHGYADIVDLLPHTQMEPDDSQ